MGVFANIYRQMSGIDMDEVFAYHTVKEVRMLDRRLGLLCWFIRLLIAAYTIGFVFIYNEGYTQQEMANGHVVTEVKGTTFSMSRGVARAWDVVDVVKPALESGALFIGTSVLHTPLQRMGNCSSPSKKCAKDSDCEMRPPLSSGHCAAGMCLEMQWCPAQSESMSDRTYAHELEGAESIRVWFKGAISFPSLDAKRLFSTIDDERPRPYAGSLHASAAPPPFEGSGALPGGGTDAAAQPKAGLPPNEFSVGELIALAGASFDAVSRTGCVLSVELHWDCFVDEQRRCIPTIAVQRLDLSPKRNGFVYNYADYFRTSTSSSTRDTDERDLYTFRGVRLLLSSRGVGKKVSLSAIMLQISSFIALLWIANYASDFLMLHVLPEKRHYRTYKQERTPDFSDLRNKIAEVEGEKKKLRERKNRFAAKIDVT